MTPAGARPTGGPPGPLLGLVVNPIAGIGGRVGLKGSDDPAIVAEARRRGAVPEAGGRARAAVEAFVRAAPGLGVLAWSGEMGEEAARAAGASTTVLGQVPAGASTAEDTRRAARAMASAGAGLLLFCGGDGTARDVLAAVDGTLPALGVPAGVKVYSAAFAVNPARAGEVAAAFLRGRGVALREAEVLDLDEAAYRAGHVSPRLAGYLRVPFREGAVQAGKAPSPAGEGAALAGIAEEVAQALAGDRLCALGPGTTTRAIAERLGVPKTLMGVDVVRGRRLLASDVGEADLLRLAEREPLGVVVSPIGGQGFVFGRGNPQIGPRVLARVTREAIMVVATPAKLAALGGRPLLVDTGDPAVDAALAGYVPVITGWRERSVYRIEG